MPNPQSPHLRLVLDYYVIPLTSIPLYLLSIRFAWHRIGYNPAFGLATWPFMFGVFPFWFSRLSSSVRSSKWKRVGAFFAYAALTVFVAYMGHFVGVHASGYIKNYVDDHSNPGWRENAGLEPIVSTFVSVLSFILYSVYYRFHCTVRNS